MIALSQNGLRFQTRALPTARAFAFGKAIQANPRFRDVQLEHLSDGTRRYRVSYRPASRRREAELIADQQVARIERAATADPHKYQTSEWDCSCPDRVYRGRANGLACKHMIAAMREGQRTLAEAAADTRQFVESAPRAA